MPTPKRSGSTTAPKPALSIPAILVEGDRPSPPPESGLGKKYSIGPSTRQAGDSGRARELPEAYGTGGLFLVARDPHTLYVHWDFTQEQLQQYNALSIHRHLVVRVHYGDKAGPPVQEVHVHPESRHWFLHVHQAETRFVAELGYYRAESQWVPVATSRLVATPPDNVCEDKSAHFATLPSFVREQIAGRPGVPAAPLGAEWPGGAFGDEGPPNLIGGRETEYSSPLSYFGPGAVWNSAQEMALAGLLVQASATRERPSSAASADFERPQFGEAPSSPTAGFGVTASSPFGAEEKAPRGFWFNLNAELTLYGGTEPGASVSIAGRSIELRPDGTFSCRFALPDGQYELTATAISSAAEIRQAVLKFGRDTRYQGEVSVAPSAPLVIMPVSIPKS